MADITLFPAHAGVIPVAARCSARPWAFPRTRGGDPTQSRPAPCSICFSPHTRG